tara:strand:- start:707 stop:1279 length:573 start_codon:yes stop_codon:yes gene_type:complete
MNIYNHKNITTNVTTIKPEWVGYKGETRMTLKSDFVAELIENSCMFQEFFVGYDCDCHENFDSQDEEETLNYFKNLNEEVIVNNADAIIAVYEYALDNSERQFSLDVETENISWVIHDILHAVKDASGCTIYVESSVEAQRIMKSLEITKEQFPNELPDYTFLSELEEEFYNRFKTRLDLEEFKEMEEYY